MKKFLIIRFSSIGDIVLTTPVIRCLKQQSPGAEIHYVTKAAYLPLIAGNPYIDKIFSFNKEITEILEDLKNEDYDHIIDLHKNMRSFRLILNLRKPFTSFPKLNIKKYIICKFKINTLPDIHIVDRYFRAVKKFNIKNDGKGLDYFIPAGIDPRQKMPELPESGYIALVIGGKHATKQLPKEKLLELCRSLTKAVIILGGSEDIHVADYILNNLVTGIQDHQASVFSACGRLTVNESAAILRAADLVIAHDTGLMHISAALRKDIISIWGNTIPAFGMYPYFPEDYKGNSRIVEVKGLPCRPCSKLGYKRCPKGHFRCMNDMVVFPE